MSYIWPEEREKQLKKLHAEGLTNKQVAIEMGCFDHCPDGGRSAVSGKIARLGLPPVVSREKPHGIKPKAAEPKPKKPGKIASQSPGAIRNPSRNIVAAAAIAAAEPGVPEHLKGEEPDGTGIQLCDLTEFTCRWPRGDPKTPNFEFCGRLKPEEVPYCARHSALAYAPPQNRST